MSKWDERKDINFTWAEWKIYEKAAAAAPKKEFNFNLFESNLQKSWFQHVSDLSFWARNSAIPKCKIYILLEYNKRLLTRMLFRTSCIMFLKSFPFLLPNLRMWVKLYNCILCIIWEKLYNCIICIIWVKLYNCIICNFFFQKTDKCTWVEWKIDDWIIQWLLYYD